MLPPGKPSLRPSCRHLALQAMVRMFAWRMPASSGRRLAVDSGTSMCRQHCRTLVDGLDGKRVVESWLHCSFCQHGYWWPQQAQKNAICPYVAVPLVAIWQEGPVRLGQRSLVVVQWGPEASASSRCDQWGLGQYCNWREGGRAFFAALVCGQAWAMQILWLGVMANSERTWAHCRWPCPAC